MDAGLLKGLGAAAGIGGIALGVFFLLFRELIRKSIFPKLDKADAYRFLQLISVLVWSVAVLGIGAWVVGNQKPQAQASTAPTGGSSSAPGIVTSGAQSPVVKDAKGDVNINFGAPPAGAAK
ncbi:MAG TPA: hypothetical protein VLX44_10290 [Xanthobacteraceae bacterium]|nr:hypothetical protein [Xanthobacteraceae bacterium]